MSADRALASAIIAAARADDSVKTLVGNPARVWDEPPAGAPYPYVTLGRMESRPADSSETEAIEHGVTLHVWSRHGGRAEAMDIIAALRARLHNASLSVSGRRLVLLLTSYTDLFRAGDGFTTHGVLRLRAITESTA
jgi:hypothetical protein